MRLRFPQGRLADVRLSSLIVAVVKTIALVSMVAFGTWWVFDLLFPLVITDLLRNQRTLGILTAILITWVVVEALDSRRVLASGPT